MKIKYYKIVFATQEEDEEVESEIDKALSVLVHRESGMSLIAEISEEEYHNEKHKFAEDEATQ